MTALASLPVLGQPGPAAGAAPGLRPAARRDLCTDCGVSRSSRAHACGRACQFIHPRYDALERQAHGRARDAARGDEAWFGPYLEMWRAALRPARPGAQWTGLTTRLAERLLETGTVDAVIAAASDPADPWRPVPALLTDPRELARCRGMKMGYAPVLALLDEAAARGLRRLAVVGVACQVHALRALEPELGLDALYVIGTPCSDNTHTEHFHQFLALLTDRPSDVTYLEFMPDYRVELRFRDGSRRHVPFIQLPIAQLPPDFIPLTCRACVDYANALADVTVGYMAGEGEQWLVVRNARGRALVALLGDEVALAPLGTRGARAPAVRVVVDALRRSAGGLPLRRAPGWARPLIAWAQRTFGPRGLEFARARVEMKLAEAVLNLRRERPRRVARMVPAHAWPLVAPYGIAPREGERPRAAGGGTTDGGGDAR